MFVIPPTEYIQRKLETKSFLKFASHRSPSIIGALCKMAGEMDFFLAASSVLLVPSFPATVVTATYT